MLRQHHIRFQDLRNFLRAYDPDPEKTVAPEEWAKTESVRYDQGMLLFYMEPVTAASGLSNLSTLGKKEGESQDTMMRVKDLCVVVGKDNGRALVVNITASAYEHRFLEVLMLEKARKAILDGRGVAYMAAQPIKPLSEPIIKELERLGNVYAQGGSRRSLAAEANGPSEPTVALLAALGARLGTPGSKQIIDIGSVCHMLFAPEGRQDDKNRALMKSCFAPIVVDASQAQKTVVAGPPSDMSRQFSAFAPEPVTPPAKESPAAAQLGLGPASAAEKPAAEAKQPLGGLQMPSPKASPAPAPPATVQAESAQTESAQTQSAQKESAGDSALFDLLTQPPGKAASDSGGAGKQAPAAKGQQSGAESTSSLPQTETYRHLAEALSGLMETDHIDDTGDPSLKKADGGASKLEQAEIGQGMNSQSEQAKSTDKQVGEKPQAEVRATEGPTVEAPKSTSPSPAGVPAEAARPPVGDADRKPPIEIFAAEREDAGKSKGGASKEREAQVAGKAAEASKPIPVKKETKAQAPGSSDDASELSVRGTFAEPQAMMNEMASLMSKLEQQVSKASKKLASRAEEIEHRLNRRIETLLDEAAQDDKNSEASILVLCDSLTKEFEQLSEELRLKISDSAFHGRETVKTLQAAGQKEMEESERTIQESLLANCKDFREHTTSLTKTSEQQLRTVVRERLEEMEDVVKATVDHLVQIADEFDARVNERFDRFTQRMSEESTAVVSSIERNVSSMGEEIDGSWERASQKLKASQSDFEQTVEHTLGVTELSISQATRTLLIEQFLPKLKERREIVGGMAAEMATAFSDQSLSQTRSQLTGLETSLASARQQLQSLAGECLSRIDSVGRQQQAGLEELFKDASGHMERSTAEVLSRVDGAEQQIHDVEGICKKLAENSSLDTDPNLSDERNAAMGKVQSLKVQVKSELEKTLESSCNNLEELGQSIQSQLNTRRIEQTQLVRDASESGLSRIKEAIQEAFSAVQTAREKYME
jgi:hypothetical protein